MSNLIAILAEIAAIGSASLNLVSESLRENHGDSTDKIIEFSLKPAIDKLKKVAGTD